MIVEDKVKMKVWYRKWENCDSISLQEIEWAEQLFTKEIAEYDFQFITTNQFLDYIQIVLALQKHRYLPVLYQSGIPN